MRGAYAEVVLEREAGHVALHVKGDLDVHCMPVLREALHEAAGDAAGEVHMFLDAARFVNTPAVEMFATTVRRVGDRGCRVVVLGVCPMQEGILRNYGLDSFASLDQPALVGS
jgi:anti-anti-sigma factor